MSNGLDRRSSPGANAAPDIVARTFQFGLSIVRLADTFDSSRETRRVILRQLIRSGTSVGANVEEAQAAESKADFIHKMAIAQKEARESRYWLKLLAQVEERAREPLGSALDESDQLVRILSSITLSARRNARPHHS
ncbi:MAG: four helix bundle protein [Planctomycetota bacterium]